MGSITKNAIMNKIILKPMEIGDVISKTKYLEFVVRKKKPKTYVIGVVNLNHNEEIGYIEWYSRWRQYCFFPYAGTIWNTSCLQDIQNVMDSLKIKHTSKTIGVLAHNVKDFILWRDKKFKSVKRVGLKRFTTKAGNQYVCLGHVNDTCGRKLDKIIETPSAKLNSNYEHLKEMAKICKKTK